MEPVFSVPDSSAALLPKGGDDRRFGMDRRRFLYDFHIPERRNGQERRDEKAQILGIEFRDASGRNSI